jgi:hypothetical protein
MTAVIRSLLAENLRVGGTYREGRSRVPSSLTFPHSSAPNTCLVYIPAPPVRGLRPLDYHPLHSCILSRTPSDLQGTQNPSLLPTTALDIAKDGSQASWPCQTTFSHEGISSTFATLPVVLVLSRTMTVMAGLSRICFFLASY